MSAKAKELSEEQQDGINQENVHTSSEANSQGQEVETAEETAVKKAGKHSAKALKEAEEKEAKAERKAKSSEASAKEESKPRVVQKVRTRLERRSKNFRKSAESIDTKKEYSLTEAIELAQKTSTVKFDATVELHVRLGVDPRHADQNIRENIVLPAGTGKTVRIAVFADVDDAKKAKDAGADIAGNEEFLTALDKGEINFDVLIATPAFMPKLGKYARVLGPKGLMPNPKSGTVAADVAKAVKEAKAGRVEYRVDSTGIVHLGVGKTSFSAADLQKNIQTVLASIKGAKPASLKGQYVQSIFLTSTMGPSIKVTASEI